MYDVTFDLHQRVAAVAPIGGVVMASPDDKATWAIDFLPEATPEQRDAAAAVLAAFEPAPPLPPSPLVCALQALAEKRWQVETGGCLVRGLGFRVATDRAAFSAVAELRSSLADAVLPKTVAWKTLDGFRSVTSADVDLIRAAMVAHRQSAFDREAALAAQIAAAPDPEAVDISRGWPPNA